MGVSSCGRIEDRSRENEGIERQGIGRIIYLDTAMTKNCDELEIKKGISELVAKSFKKLGMASRGL